MSAVRSPYPVDSATAVRRESPVSMFDKAKNLASSNKDKIKGGIDKGKGSIKDKVGGHDDKVDQGAEMAKDAIDKLDDGESSND